MLQQKRPQKPFIIYGFIDRTGQQEDADDELEGEARKEREYVRRRLREELQRETLSFAVVAEDVDVAFGSRRHLLLF